MATEIDKLDPLPDFVFLRSGLRVQLESLKARQFFKFLRILTHGAATGVNQGLFDMDDMTMDEFMGRLLSITLLSIPDAEDETIDFVRSMCYPAGLVERKPLNKQDTEHNQILWAGLDAELENPELDDLVTIIEAIVKRESEDIQALGKRLASLWKLAEKTGQTSAASPSPTVSTSVSSAESPALSTSSRRSTAGRTKSSTRSRSADSASASLQSVSTSTTPAGSVSVG